MSNGHAICAMHGCISLIYSNYIVFGRRYDGATELPAIVVVRRRRMVVRFGRTGKERVAAPFGGASVIGMLKRLRLAKVSGAKFVNREPRAFYE